MKPKLTQQGFLRTLATAMPTLSILADLPRHKREAVLFYWQRRAQQLEQQRKAGGSDQHLCSAVTGGAQMDEAVAALQETPQTYRTRRQVRPEPRGKGDFIKHQG